MDKIKWELMYKIAIPGLRCGITSLGGDEDFNNLFNEDGRRPRVLLDLELPESQAGAFQMLPLTAEICRIADKRRVASTRHTYIKADFDCVSLIDKDGYQSGLLLRRGSGPNRHFVYCGARA